MPSTPDVWRCSVCGAYTESVEHCGARCRLLLDGSRRLRLSKLMSAVLRHVAPSFGLRVDREGWVSIPELVRALRPRCPWLTEEHVVAVASVDPKGRFEVRGGLIRARYGHTLDVRIRYPEDREVRRLYHGTTASRLRSIMEEGLRPMRRRMVHLTSLLEDAIVNASRWGEEPVVLEVDADRLRGCGLKVYRASPTVYLAPYVPPSCIVRVYAPQELKRLRSEV